MLRIDRLVLAIILLAGFVSADFPYSESLVADCNDILVDSEVSRTKSDKSSIKLKVTNAKKPIRYVFYRESGELLNNEYTSSKFETGEKGKIYYAVKDANGCTVKGEIFIE